MTNNDKILFAVNSIRSYLVKSPNATDTAEGIHQWWIDWGNEPVENIQTTLSALEILVASGQIESVKAGKRLIWRRKN